MYHNRLFCECFVNVFYQLTSSNPVRVTNTLQGEGKGDTMVYVNSLEEEGGGGGGERGERGYFRVKCHHLPPSLLSPCRG